MVAFAGVKQQQQHLPPYTPTLTSPARGSSVQVQTQVSMGSYPAPRLAALTTSAHLHTIRVCMYTCYIPVSLPMCMYDTHIRHSLALLLDIRLRPAG